MRQVKLVKVKFRNSYGGDLMKTRKGREGIRPLAANSTMHLVLRSTKARGAWSFRKGENPDRIRRIFTKFGAKYGVRILRLANVGNHLHLQIKLTNRFSYKPFIRATTAAICHAVTGKHRRNPLKKTAKDRFFDCRPFTRIVVGLRDLLGLKDYIAINELEGFGYKRGEARTLFRYNSA